MWALKYIIGYTTMKPENFILNSDYLSLSTESIITQSITFVGGTLPALGHQKQTVNIAAPKVEQAEFQYMISSDNSKWGPSRRYDFDYNSSVMASLVVSRIDASTIQATLLVANKTQSEASYPQKQFWVKEAAVIAPDMK